MENINDSKHESAIIAYLTILQSTISRMGMNSLYCKILCGTLLATLGTISTLVGRNLFLTSLFPLFICAYADATYLSLERVYREKYNKLVEKYYRNCQIDDVPALFDMNPGTEYRNRKNQKRSFRSWSVWCIYLVLFIYVLVISLMK